MKKLLLPLSLLFSSTVFADPTVFNLTLNKTTEEEAKQLYNLDEQGINQYSNGMTYSVNTNDIEFDGLEKLTLTFNDKGILAYVGAVFPDYKYDSLLKSLASKYKLISKKEPFVGDKSAKFKDGTTEIYLEDLHLGGFKATLDYIHQDLMKKYKEMSAKQKETKSKKEASML